jgi:hypothetical protein
MQKMIARGETERAAVGGTEGGRGKESIHLWILQSASVEDTRTGGKLPTQGRKEDYEASRKTQERLSLIQEELKRMIPGWSGGGGGETQEPISPKDLDSRSLLDAVSELTESGERLSVTRDLVASGLSNLFAATSESGMATLGPESFALLVNIFDRSRDSTGLLQVSSHLHDLPWEFFQEC